MKKRVFCILLLIIFAFSVSACKNEEQLNTNTNTTVNEKPKEIEIITASSEDPRTTEIGTKLSEFSFNLDDDTQEEKIELYTAAGRHENGEMLWDDGQNWLLVVVDGDQYYSLISGYVQLGQVYYDFALIGEDNIPTITTYISTSSSMQLLSYSYDREEKNFKGSELYQSTNRNGFFTSIPGY